MTFTPEVRAGVVHAARERGMDPLRVLAVAMVESGGVALVDVRGKLLPLILYEYHVFDRNCRPEVREQARHAGLSARSWGEIPYPKSMERRYDLLARAAELDPQAAHAACSWGVGQVLGENWQWLGYPSPIALADHAKSGVAGQVHMMLTFIEKRNLVPALRAGDWETFARIYNGRGQVTYYAGRLRAAFNRLAAEDRQA